MKKYIFFMFFFLYSLQAGTSQFILQQIDIIKNYKVEKEFFDYTVGDFYLKNFQKKTILVEKNNNLKKTLKSLFKNMPVEILSEAVVSNFTLKKDKIIAKKILILDRDYEIVDIDKKEFYKFTLYVKKKEKKGFFYNILKQFKIEYGYKSY